VRVREDFGEHESRQKVVDLVETDEPAVAAARTLRNARVGDHAMPAVLLEAEVRHRADESDEDEGLVIPPGAAEPAVETLSASCANRVNCTAADNIPRTRTPTHPCETVFPQLDTAATTRPA
jgi:hypothetical protein